MMNQVDLVSVKELLGHGNISTTMIYSHVSKDYKEKTVAKIPEDKNIENYAKFVT